MLLYTTQLQNEHLLERMLQKSTDKKLVILSLNAFHTAAYRETNCTFLHVS